MFEVQRIWDVWPHLQGVQVLRTLFRQTAVPTTPGSGVTGVFVAPGHVFVATSHASSQYEEGSCSVCLYAFSCAPLKPASQSHDSHMTTTCLLPLTDGCSRVVDVIANPREELHQTWVVHDSGKLSVFNFDTENYTWKLKESLPLSPDSDLYSCCCLPSGWLLYCEQLASGGSHGYQVSCRRFENSPEGSLCLSAATVLLTGCPPMHLRPFGGGVCLLPSRGPAPSGLLLVWREGEKVVQPYIWNGPHTLPPHPPTTHYRTIILRLAGLCEKVSQDPTLIAMTTHPVTNQLLAVANNGIIYELLLKKGVINRKQLLQLSDFPRRYTSIPGVFEGGATLNGPQLFCLHTHYGLCCGGDLRLYDSFTGQFLWEHDEQEGAGTQLWTTPTSLCGLYSNSGVWLLRSKRITEHAQWAAQRPLPSNNTRLEGGRVLAARLCRLWGLELLATKYSLEAAYHSTKQEREREGGIRQPLFSELSQELVAQLGGGSLHSPALLVALLAENPSNQCRVSDHVSEFLASYHSSEQRPTDQLLTEINAENVPLLEQYQQLTEQYEHILSQDLHDALSSSLPSARHIICEALTNLEQAGFDSEESIASVRAQLHSLTHAHPHEALQGITDFFGVTSFENAVKQLHSGSWQSRRNWRSIFGVESASRLQHGFVQATMPPQFPIFELTCRLLYQFNPSELLPFVTFAQLARDHQSQGDSAFARKCRKNYFYHRALDALPTFISSEATPTSPEAIQVRCQLLLQRSALHIVR